MPRIRNWKDWIPASGEGRALVEVKGRVGGKGSSRFRRSPGDREDSEVPVYRPRRKFRMSRAKGFWDAISFNQAQPGSAALQEPGDLFTWVGGHFPILYIYPKVAPPASLTTQQAVGLLRPGHETKMQLLKMQGTILGRMEKSQVAGEEAVPARHVFITYEWAKLRVAGLIAETRYLRGAADDNLNAAMATLEAPWLLERLGDKAAQSTNTIAGIPGQVSGGIPGHRVRDDVMMRGIVIPQHQGEFVGDLSSNEITVNSPFFKIPYPKRPRTVLDAESDCLVLSLQLWESGTRQPIAVGRNEATNRYKFEFRTETLRGLWLPA